jgi:TRAP-type C4-dicarboxylate transport system permease small subunit
MSQGNSVRKLIDYLDQSLIGLSLLVFVVMLGAVLVQIVARYALESSPAWTEEITRFMLIYLVALSVGSCAYRRELVNVDIVINMLPPQARRWMQMAIDLLIAVFFMIFAYFVNAFLAFQAMQQATTLPLPMSYITFSLMVLCLNIAFFSAVNIVSAFGDRSSRNVSAPMSQH